MQAKYRRRQNTIFWVDFKRSKTKRNDVEDFPSIKSAQKLPASVRSIITAYDFQNWGFEVLLRLREDVEEADEPGSEDACSSGFRNHCWDGLRQFRK